MNGTVIEKTYEGRVLIEYEMSAPNDDVNTGAPRIDPITGEVIVSAESLRRKIRDYLGEKFQYEPPYDILMRRGEGLVRKDGENFTIDDQVQRVRKLIGLGQSKIYSDRIKSAKKKASKKKVSKKSSTEKLSAPERFQLREGIITTFVDARAFGALLNVGSDKTTNIRGGFQIHPGMSVHPVMDMFLSNTREMLTHEGERKTRNKLIGNREILRYALVRHSFVISPASARVSGLTMEDVYEILEALNNCWVQDSVSYRRATLRGLWLIECPEHGRRPLGYTWDDVIEIKSKLDDPVMSSKFEDFEINVHTDRLPPGVRIYDLPQIAEMIDLYDEKDDAAE